MALQVLEDSVRTRLQSGVAITSMAQCVDELVENCIDAGATCIAVRIDLNRYKIQVYRRDYVIWGTVQGCTIYQTQQGQQKARFEDSK